MATRIAAKYKDLLTPASDVESWFQKFRYHLLEEELVVPVPADTANVTDPETTAINTMKRKIVIHLINSMDTDMFSKLKTLIAPRDPINETIESIEQTLIAHLAPKPTILSERHSFYLLKQKDEDTGQFITRLREQAIKCQFNEGQLNERIRDQFVVGINCMEAREALLSEDITELTLEAAFKKTVAVERSRREAQNLGNSSSNIHQIHSRSKNKQASNNKQCEKCGKNIGNMCRCLNVYSADICWQW